MLDRTESLVGFFHSRSFVASVVCGIAAAEVVTSFSDPAYGILCHSIILGSLLALSTLRYGESPYSALFLSLSLAPLIRVISLSVPLINFPRFSWYAVSSIPIFLATLTLMRLEGTGFRDVGINSKMPVVQGLVALMGLPFGIIESYILKPELLVVDLPYRLLSAMALVFSTGFVEELVFRGVMQRNATKAFGGAGGVMVVAAVFAYLHIGWLSLLEVVFVFLLGLWYGYLSLETGSIMGVSLSHGFINVYLFMMRQQ